MKLLTYFVLIMLFMIFNVFTHHIIMNYYNSKLRENFTPSYQQCINSGYSKEFCVQTPTSVVGPSGCQCHDGSLGYIIPGFRGKCLCNQ